jgi:hypothetical protein
MKLLTATAVTQGFRRNDFHWCVEGELVSIDPVCRSDRDDPDGRCGCGRAFAGLASRHATTTAMVRDLANFTRVDYLAAFRTTRQGCDPAAAEDEAADLLRLAERWPVGAVVERRLDTISLRAAVECEACAALMPH